MYDCTYEVLFVRKVRDGIEQRVQKLVEEADSAS